MYAYLIHYKKKDDAFNNITDNNIIVFSTVKHKLLNKCISFKQSLRLKCIINPVPQGSNKIQFNYNNATF